MPANSNNISDFNREYRRLKGRLTKAINSNDCFKVINEVHYAQNRFNSLGWPDDWSDWVRAYNDACFQEAQIGRIHR